MDSTLHSNVPTPSTLMKLKPLPPNYTDVDTTVQPDAPIPPLPIERNPVTYKEVVHIQPQEQQYSTICPSNPLMNNVQVDGEEYSKLNHDVHAKSMQPLHSEGSDFTPPQHQSAVGGYSTLPLNSKYQTQSEMFTTLPGQISPPETCEDNCYCSFTSLLHIIICYTDDHNPQLTYKFLMDHIVSEIPLKWYEFGSALAITPPQMEEIKENHPSNENRAFADVIQIWQTEEPRPFTFETLVMVLESSTVNEPQLVPNQVRVKRVL